MDVLNSLEEIKICTSYKVNGEETKRFPDFIGPNTTIEPVYQTLPGWQTDIADVTDYDALPKAAKEYIEFIEKELDLPVELVSNGRRRRELIRR